MDEIDTLNKIIDLAIEIDEAKKVKCTCSGFVLQYEGSCGCGAGLQVDKAKANFWNFINLLK